MHSLRFRIFFLVAALLILVQAVTMISIYGIIRREVERGLAAQLDVGRQVFLSQFRTRRQNLTVFSRAIAKDFGLLSAFHDDPKSFLVALDNDRRRVGADLAVAVDNDGRIRADTVQPELAGQPFVLSGPAHGTASGQAMFLSANGHTYQVVEATFLAPNPVGHLFLGFVVDDVLAGQFESITSLHVTFFARDAQGHWNVVASSLPSGHRAMPAPEPLGPQGTGAPYVERVQGARFLSLALPLGGHAGTPVVALLQSSEEAAYARYRVWWLRMFEVFAASLVLAVVGVWAVARGVVRPVRMLVEQARAIARGNYTRPIGERRRGEVGDLVEEFNQMQRAIAEREASIRHHANHDALTGVANRYRLEELIGERIREAGEDQRLGVLVVDLDRFRDINDTLGHQSGDRLLQEVARRLQQAVRPGDVVARLGGDGFGVLIAGLALSEIQSRVQVLCEAVMQPYRTDGLSLQVSSAMGVAIYPDHGRDAASLLQCADIAHQAAKHKHARYALYEGSQDRYSLLRLSLLGEMQSAMERGDLVLYFQPKLDLAENVVRSAEVLVRWRHPEYGLISPAEFVPMVERTGNIQVLTRWVMHQAAQQAACWQRDGIPVRLAVNVSAYDLRRVEFPGEVRQALEDSGAVPEMLTLEITESALMEDVAQSLAALDELHRLGITFSIDDYGTGYSSMAQLKKLPVHELKIDQSFVTGVDRNADDELIVRSTIELGHNLRLKVTAEGVETRRHLDILRQLGCDTAQGFFIGYPMAAKAFATWYAGHGRWQ